MKTERKRKANFTHEEILTMLSMVKDNHDLFESKFNNQVTNRKKDDKWNEIARVLSAMEVEVRDVAEI